MENMTKNLCQKFTKNMNKFDNILKLDKNYVKQFMYIYDYSKLTETSNGYDNLELYSILLQRLDISDISMKWLRVKDGSTFFVCMYKEKSEYFVETKSNGIHVKTWLHMYIKNNTILEKKNIDVEIIWN